MSNFESEVIKAVEDLGPKAWGANIQRILSEKLGRDVSLGQLYFALHDLEENGALTSEKMQPDQDGRVRRLFRCMSKKNG